MALGQHLSAEKNIGFTLSELCQNPPQLTFALGCITIETQNFRRREMVRQPLFQLLDPDTQREKPLAAAFRAKHRYRLLTTAVVTNQLIKTFMKGQMDRTKTAIRHITAIKTVEGTRKTALI